MSYYASDLTNTVLPAAPAMTSASPATYRAYLRMGSLWPQLRGPLAIAVLAASRRTERDPWVLFDRTALTVEQRRRTRATAARLHRSNAINARELTDAMADLEWHRAISAATYLTLNVLERHPHRRYDPWHDYVAEAREAGCFDRIRTAPQGTFDGLFDLVHRVEALLRREGALAAAFRASYTPDLRRRAWAARGSLPEPVTPALLVDDPAGCRRAILNQLRRRTLTFETDLPAKARRIAALGIDWKH